MAWKRLNLEGRPSAIGLTALIGTIVVLSALLSGSLLVAYFYP